MEPCKRFQATFVRDLTIYIPNGSVCEKQIDLRSPQEPGKYTRPQAFVHAEAVNVEPDGSFAIYWPDQSASYVNAAAVLSYAVE